MNRTPSCPVQSVPLFPRPVSRALLLAGPALTAHFLAGALGDGPAAGQLPVALACMVALLWSPLPMMLPALVLQDASAEAGHGPWTGPVRSHRSLLARGSSVRAEAALALAGWVAGLTAAALHLL